MCGIGGIFDFNNSRLTTDEMARFVRPLARRGPDREQHFNIEKDNFHLWFAHRRLSIIDLSANADQPMTSYSGKSTIVFNGEIYNYKALARELRQAGYTFKSSSDTEVILNGFEHWGISGILQRLDGMFAFAIFDHTHEKLILARDCFGKKPLYFHCSDHRLIFSSDIRSFGAINGVSLNVDLYALGYYFAELSTPHQNTIWKEVKKLEPSSYLEFAYSGVTVSRSYWKLHYSGSCTLSREEILSRVNDLLSEAVKKRLVADVRVSAMLSGGIDSSLVVAKMSEASRERIRTYSVGFTDQSFNELQHARVVAEKFGTDHTELVVKPGSLDDIGDLIAEFGEPFADSSMIPTYFIAREISKNEKVVLGGDGGDEIFAGYYSYYFAHKLDRVKKFASLKSVASIARKLYPSYRTRLLETLLERANFADYKLLDRGMGFDEAGLRQLVDDPVFYGALAQEHQNIWDNFSADSPHALINVSSASMYTRLLNDYLVKVDRASMFASLEVRSPFLDKELAEFSATLTPHQLFDRRGTKSILKDLAGRYFSAQFIDRRKMGFSIPVGQWFRNELADHLKDVILGGKQSMIQLNYRFVERLIDEHVAGIKDHNHRVWTLYVFHIWAANQ